MAKEVHRDDASMTHVDSDASRQLQHIKARTMFNMVEELDEGVRTVLFLTNTQAELISTSENSMQKMLDAFDIHKPQLVINLLQSPGFRDFLNFADEKVFEAAAAAGLAGMKHNRAPFATREEERDGREE